MLQQFSCFQLVFDDFTLLCFTATYNTIPKIKKMFHLTLLGWINTYNTLVIPALDNQHELVNLSFYKSLRTLPEKKVLTFSRNAFQKLEAEEDRNTHSVIGYIQQPTGKQEFRSATQVLINVQVQS